MKTSYAVFHKYNCVMGSEASGIQLIAVDNLAARCHYILQGEAKSKCNN